MRQSFRLLVTGSRTWDDVQAIERALAVILDRHPEGVLLVHGACPHGADAIAAAYAARTPGYRIEAHPADWRRYGRAAGYRRNAEMIALVRMAAPRSSEAAVPAARVSSGWPGLRAYPSGFTSGPDRFRQLPGLSGSHAGSHTDERPCSSPDGCEQRAAAIPR